MSLDTSTALPRATGGMLAPLPRPSADAPAIAGKRHHRWGYLALGISVLCIGVAVNLTHEATMHLPVLWVVAILCLVGPIAAMTIGWTLRRFGMAGGLASVTPSSQARQLRRRGSALVCASIFGAAAAALMVFVVQHNGAATAAFLNNLGILFVVFGGVWAGERLNGAAIAAIVAMIAGAFIYSLTKDVRVAGPALGIMVVSCLGSAIKQCIVARSAPPEELASFVSAKQVCMAVMLLAAALAVDGPRLHLDRWLACAVAAGVLQSALGMLLMYVGYQIVGLARGAPTTALRPIVVLLIGLAFRAAMPSPVQLIGAFLIVTGAVVLCARHRTPESNASSPSAMPDLEDETAVNLEKPA